MGIFDFLTSIFGDSRANEISQNNVQMQKDLLKRQTDFEDQLSGQLQPSVNDPGGFVNQIAADYQGGEYQNYISGEMNTALNNQLRAQGLNGSSVGFGEIARLNSGLAGAELGNFMRLALGARETGLSGLLNNRSNTIAAGNNLNSAASNSANNRVDAWKALAGLGGSVGKSVASIYGGSKDQNDKT